MEYFLLILYILFTFGISYLNAWGVGRNWTETKIASGWPRFLNWCGAIMAACGFTWVYFIIFALILGAFQVFTVGEVQAFLEAGYLLIILPILGSGLFITIETWAQAWKKHDLPHLALTAYNTYAMVHNTYHAIQGMSGAWGTPRRCLGEHGQRKRRVEGSAFCSTCDFHGRPRHPNHCLDCLEGSCQRRATPAPGLPSLRFTIAWIYPKSTLFLFLLKT